MNKRLVAVVGLCVLGAAWWFAAAPKPYIVSAEAHQVPPVPAALLAATQGDLMKASATSIAKRLGGHDEIVLQEELGRAFVSARDGWIWQVNLKTGDAEPFVRAPMSPTGARLVPGQTEQIYFCMARLDDERYPSDQLSGIYRLDIAKKTWSPVATRVPTLADASAGLDGVVHVPFKGRTAVAQMNDSNSRPVQFCNDLDVSRDGQRLYMSEPYAWPDAASGTGAVREAITLARNGRLWMFDLADGTASLVAENYAFLDGVLLEHGSDGRATRETGVLITETSKYRINRLHLSGPKQGQGELLWDGLPGLPDGLDRDADGRVWVALIKTRSALATWIHANPWLKPLMLRLPQRLLPVDKTTAIMALSPDASQVLLYTLHDGSVVRDISVVVPGKDRLYLSSFDKNHQGLTSMPYPKLGP